jgi:hypothetical protein
MVYKNPEIIDILIMYKSNTVVRDELKKLFGNNVDIFINAWLLTTLITEKVILIDQYPVPINNILTENVFDV